jgi:hypothetical protein
MTFRIHFLDAWGSVMAEWLANAFGVPGAIDLVEGLEWPEGAVVMRIVDADGRVVHVQTRPQPQP